MGFEVVGIWFMILSIGGQISFSFFFYLLIKYELNYQGDDGSYFSRLQSMKNASNKGKYLWYVLLFVISLHVFIPVFNLLQNNRSQAILREHCTNMFWNWTDGRGSKNFLRFTFWNWTDGFMFSQIVLVFSDIFFSTWLNSLIRLYFVIKCLYFLMKGWIKYCINCMFWILVF